MNTVRAADVLRRTAPGPVYEGCIFPVRGAVANLLDDHVVPPVVSVAVRVDDPDSGHLDLIGHIS